MPKARLAHVALNAKNPIALAQFYHEMFGMQIVGGAKVGSNAFVASNPHQENHDIAFFKDNPNAAHVGLRVESPAELLAFYQEIKARGLKIFFTWNHGFALAIYFADPEGNVIEVYWPTGREDYQPPYVEQLNLEGQTEESLRQLVATMPGQNQK
jgi:catechol-2,3-dioxygenase